MTLVQFRRNMVIFNYLLKLIKRIGFCVILVLLTFLLVVSIPGRDGSEETDITIDTATTFYKNTHSNGVAKFILLWTDPKASPFNYLGKGSSVFKSKSCKYTNCYVTGDSNELGDTSLFDAVLFNGPQLQQMRKYRDLPTSRSAGQKYVYANVESAQNYPLCNFNGFFNWTWTYRLDSDVNWAYYVVKNRTGHVVAPKMDAVWESRDNMEDIGEKLKVKLKRKTKAVAWFASNCHTKSRREDYVDSVREHLRNYSLQVDVYGACGTLQCPAHINERCLRLLKKEYYFYFAFENSLSVDYVTEKVLNAVKHDTVPVVYGSANYSRFLPPGSYLNAIDMGPEKLAATINNLIKDPEAYCKYFRWQKYYSFHYRHESPDTDDYCKFCEELNSNRMLEESIHWRVNEWWNDGHNCTHH